MPHCIIEYSQDMESIVQPVKLVEAVHKGVTNSDLFETSHIRIRAVPYENYISGYQVDYFVHTTLKILSGRNQQQKKTLSELVLRELEEIGLSAISITIEVADIERETYVKRIINRSAHED